LLRAPSAAPAWAMLAVSSTDAAKLLNDISSLLIGFHDLNCLRLSLQTEMLPSASTDQSLTHQRNPQLWLIYSRKDSGLAMNMLR
jgi:hypothetical protein